MFLQTRQLHIKRKQMNTTGRTTGRPPVTLCPTLPVLSRRTLVWPWNYT